MDLVYNEFRLREQQGERPDAAAIQVMTAGRLLRRRGVHPAMLLPYQQRTVPVTFLVDLSGALIGTHTVLRYSIDLRPTLIGYPPTFGLLALALTGALRGWPWPVRLGLHAGRLAGIGMLAAHWVALIPR
jgi:hypothetical protein